MQTCKGCREQQTIDALCPRCIEDLGVWLRQIPDLYQELNFVRLPGSVPRVGPRTRSVSGAGSASPVRLVVVDLLDRGETLRRLWAWTGNERKFDCVEICDGFRHHLLSIVAEPWAGDFYRAMRALCRDLGRAVGQSEEQSVGKCPEPVGDTDELCRGRLYRTPGGTECRRCGATTDPRQARVWASCVDAAILAGRPVKTIRTWRDRGRVERGQLPLVDPQLVWLPDVIRRAEALVATLPQSHVRLSPGSGAELSVRQAPSVRAVAGAEAVSAAEGPTDHSSVGPSTPQDSS